MYGRRTWRHGFCMCKLDDSIMHDAWCGLCVLVDILTRSCCCCCDTPRIV
ncbi:hypothetical protein EJ05DRAFT_535491 [Pseudovirgaria hyperparasitica]|uniref:Uncharacterized protein n=1 Tax=Pseudovirgaria hyperparasitica TaxID=470096 RepID=A0A6A6WJ67_9PEZI|nr:uncharacterized protein EJ05DRAFT_535491 [Pseudovirgaria hyperparasitica]KAF2762245.1 hypothetical protein EJ05DRAFT_535491 [Pseudovirgaria hyperparasitica]